MAVKYESYAQQVKNSLDEATLNTLDNIGEFVRKKAHDRCAVKGGTSIDGVYTSPYEPKNPARSGATRKSIKYEVNKREKSVRIGTNSIIAPPLEKGTARETAKPFLTPAAEENIGQIVDIGKKGLSSLG